MSMVAHALCDRPLRSIAEWQAAIDALGFELELHADRNLVSDYGHLPAVWRGQEAGFECSMNPISELLETYPRIDFGGPWSCDYAFYFYIFPGAAGTWMAIAACIAVTGGLAFDPQEGHLMNAEQARTYALQAIASAEREMRL